MGVADCRTYLSDGNHDPVPLINSLHEGRILENSGLH